MFALRGQNYSSLYLNGNKIYYSLYISLLMVNSSNTYVPPTESNGFFLYSVSPSRVISSCSDATVSVTIAAVSTSVISEAMKDHFDLTVYLIPDGSSRTIESSITSQHWKDYFSNPLSLAIDSDRFTGWKVKGRFADFTMTFNSGRFEYLNAYQITCGIATENQPTSWIVKGCTQGDNGWSCDMLDTRSNVIWDGPVTTREYLMNNLHKSYQRYLIDLRAPETGSEANSQLWISEITFISRSQLPSETLQYPSSLLSLFVNLDDVFLEPSSGYTEFSVYPDLPYGMSIDPVSGLIWGRVYESDEMVFTITAKHGITGDNANTTLTIRSSGKSKMID